MQVEGSPWAATKTQCKSFPFQRQVTKPALAPSSPQIQPTHSAAGCLPEINSTAGGNKLVTFLYHGFDKGSSKQNYPRGWRGFPHLHSLFATTNLKRRGGSFPGPLMHSSRLRQASLSSGTETGGLSRAGQKILQKDKLSMKHKLQPLPDNASGAYLPQSC